MMFESHLKLFSLLVTLERLRLSRRLSTEELSLFVNGIDASAIEVKIASDDKPDWLGNMVRGKQPLRGFAKIKNSKNPSFYGSGWVQVSLGILFFFDNLPKIALNQC